MYIYICDIYVYRYRYIRFIYIDSAAESGVGQIIDISGCLQYYSAYFCKKKYS